MKKIIYILILSQISIGCTAAHHEPTKPPFSVPQSPQVDLGQKPTKECSYSFSTKQTLKDIALTSGLMSRECGLSLQEISVLAESVFNKP